MEKLLTDERLVSVLGEVNGEFIDYIQNIADYGEQLEEIAQKEKEALTGIGLDEFKSGYVDLLSDLDSTNEEFADNFEKYLQKAIFSSLIANKYKDEIESCITNGRQIQKVVASLLRRKLKGYGKNRKNLLKSCYRTGTAHERFRMGNVRWYFCATSQ